MWQVAPSPIIAVVVVPVGFAGDACSVALVSDSAIVGLVVPDIAMPAPANVSEARLTPWNGAHFCGIGA